MKAVIGVAMMFLGIFIAGLQIGGCVRSNYSFEKKYLYAWELADRSSTIEAKANYIQQFVDAISTNKDDFAEYNAIWLQTPENKFENNVSALVSLKDRLNEIRKMDVSSFQYNTAIQQITAQEQGEAHGLIRHIQGCYDLENYWYVWDWIGGVFTISAIVLCIVGGGVALDALSGY